MTTRRRTSRTVLPIALATLLVAIVATPVDAAPVAAAPGGGSKVQICHRTHSTTNPYRLISVSTSAINGSSANDHTRHAGGVFQPGYTYPPQTKVWGDIAPPAGSSPGVNWPSGAATLTAALAAHPGVACGPMTAQEFYNVEREAGVPHADIVLDLQEQQADADPPVESLAAISYTGDDPAVLEEETGTDPDPSDPGPTDPDPSDPGPTDPDPSDPGPSDPGPSDPGPSDPDPSDPGPSPTQRVTGVVWLDLDRDGRQGPREPGLKGARVSLVRTTAATTLAAYAALPAAAPASRTTGVGGTYTFEDVPVGVYRVVVDRPPRLDVTWDSEGAADGEAAVDVPTGTDGYAAVGLVGPGTVAVTVRTPDARPVVGDVVLRWAGLDGVLDTDDDALLPATTDASGTISLTGLPSGTYVLESSGTSTGTFGVEPGTTTGILTVGTPAAPPAVTPSVPRGTLAATGGSATLLLMWAAGLVLAGSALVARRGRWAAR